MVDAIKETDLYTSVFFQSYCKLHNVSGGKNNFLRLVKTSNLQFVFVSELYFIHNWPVNHYFYTLFTSVFLKRLEKKKKHIV